MDYGTQNVQRRIVLMRASIEHGLGIVDHARGFRMACANGAESRKGRVSRIPGASMRATDGRACLLVTWPGCVASER